MATLGLAMAFLLVAANGFFVAAEFSLARVRPTQVATWERVRRPGARSLRHALDNLDAYLAACQLGVTVASLGLGAIGEPAFHDLLEPLLGDSARIASVGLAAAVAFAIITGLHVVVGELAPKSVAIARTERTALVVATPMRLFYLLTKPVADVLNGIGKLVIRPFGIPPAREVGHAPPTEDELHELLRESSRRGLIDADEQVLSENALMLDEVRIGEIMVPRDALKYAATDMDARAVIELMRQTGVTRLPLCEPDGGLDAAIGLIESDGLLFAFTGDGVASLIEIARPLSRVRDVTAADDVLAGMVHRGERFALVIDEHGSAVGGASLENIIELMVRGVERGPSARRRP